MVEDDSDLISCGDLNTTDFEPPEPQAPPERIGHYRILQRIGAGGMGEVFAAEQQAPVRRRVALKLIKPGMDSEQVLARFSAERQALALMNHPAIAQVFDAGMTEQGRSYFAMEFVKGAPITEYCDAQRLATRQRLELFTQVCEGVQHAHQKGIIHRDIKPSNVLVEIRDDGVQPKIIDFGVAKATGGRLTDETYFTEYGQLIGTPEYMSPEQAEMSTMDVDTRSDVYSLGVLLYELLVGALPFDRGWLRRAGLDELRRVIREEEPPKPSTRVYSLGAESEAAAKRRSTETRVLSRLLQGDLDWVVLKAMEKDRTRRYASASELAADVTRYLDNQPVAAGPPSKLYRARKFVLRHKTGVGFAVVLALLLIGFAVVMALQAKRIADERDRASDETRAAEEVAGFLVDLFKVPDARSSPDRTVSATDVLDNGARQIREREWKRPLTKARMMHTMGQTFANLLLVDDARPLLTEALEIRRRELGDNHPDVARTLDVLAGLLLATDDYEGSRELYERNVEILEVNRGTQPGDLARALNNLANVLHETGEFEQALGRHRRALALREKTYGPDHEQTAKSLNNVANMLRFLGDHEAARRMYERALSIHRRHRTDEGLDAAMCLTNLGYLEVIEGNLDRAGRNFERSLEIYQRAWGPDHRDVGLALAELALHRARQGRTAQARGLDATAMDILERTMGSEHRLVLFYRARFELLTGNGAKGSALLRRSAVDKGYPSARMLRIHPDLVSLRDQPEFERMLSQVEDRVR